MTIAVYPGSFDPPTQGHISVVKRGLKLFDHLIVAVSVNFTKQTTFTAAERVALLKDIFRNQPHLEIDTFEGRLLVDYVRSKKAGAVLRGLRTVQDYEYEYQMSLANRRLAPEIETVFMMTEAQHAHVSSSLIKEIVSLGGSAEGMLPWAVEAELKKKLKSERKKVSFRGKR